MTNMLSDSFAPDRGRPLLQPLRRRRASSGIEFRNRFNPLESVQVARLIQACHLNRDSSTDCLRACIGYDQPQLTQAAHAAPL